MEYAKVDYRRRKTDGSRTKAPVRGKHRIIVETALGRNLLPSEVVHHKNGDKRDNRPENLEITTRAKHASLHAAERRESSVSCIARYCSSTTIAKSGLCHKHSTIQGMWARKRGGRTGDWLADWLSIYKPRAVK